MGKYKGNRMDEETEWESSGWRSTKGMNGWGNTKENIRIGEK